MHTDKIKEAITKIYHELNDPEQFVDSGSVATYIPELARVDPTKFSISTCFIDGSRFDIGDSDERFCMQSCSKVLSYCHVYDTVGKTKLHKHVGYEPSGQAFNAFALSRKNIPFNPCVNSGGIMVCSFIGKNKEPSERFRELTSAYSKMSGGGRIGFDNSVFLSEQHHSDRNISLGYYMRENGAFGKEFTPNDITDTLSIYHQQCSTTITSRLGAVMAGTLANGGVCPTTKERVISMNAVKDCLSIMCTCGMYDYSGQFFFEQGMPAKSGVSGCILLVIPNKIGICIWAPPLDALGNSCKGIEFCKRLNQVIDFHLIHNVLDQKIDFGRHEAKDKIAAAIRVNKTGERVTLPVVAANRTPPSPPKGSARGAARRGSPRKNGSTHAQQSLPKI